MKHTLIIILAPTMLWPMDNTPWFMREKKKRTKIITITTQRIKRQKCLDDPVGEGINRPPLLCFSHSDKYVNYTQELLTHGANPNVIVPDDLFHQTALFTATAANAVETVEELLKHGANPNIFNMKGQSPLSLICEARYDKTEPEEANKRIKIARLLLAKKANPNECKYKRPFINDTPLVQLLLNLHSGSTYNVGITELFTENREIICAQRKKIIKALIGYRADVYAQKVHIGVLCENHPIALKQAYDAKDPTAIELAKYTQTTYALWQLLCCRIALKNSSSPLRIIPTDVLKLIADNCYGRNCLPQSLHVAQSFSRWPYPGTS